MDVQCINRTALIEVIENGLQIDDLVEVLVWYRKPMEPLEKIVFIVVAASAVHPPILGFFGGRGLSIFLGIVGAAMIIALGWFAVFGNFSTGMEALAFVIWPAVFFGYVALGGLWYALFAALRWLPVQRDH